MSDKTVIRGLIDLDNVVSNWLGWVMLQVNKIPKAEGLISGRLEEMWPELTEEEVHQLVYDPRGYTEPEMIFGADTVLWRMARDPRIQIMYLSAAPDGESFKGRKDWMSRIGFPMSKENGVLDLIHVNGSENKVQWIMNQGEGYSFIVDDHLSYLDAALLSGIKHRYVFDNLWNRNDGNHQRVRSWQELWTRLKVDLLS
jgi:5'(3')-deoxyribonucleotidase